MKKQASIFNIREQIIQVIESFGSEELPVTPIGKKQSALELIDKVGRLNATIALYPLPIADILLMTPIQISMVLKIAKIYGIKTNNSIIRELIITVAKGFLTRALTRNIIKFVPLLGVPVSIFMSYFMTKVIGITAIRVFEKENSDSSMTLKERFKKEYELTLSYFDSAIYSFKEKKEPIIKDTRPEILDEIFYIPCNN